MSFQFQFIDFLKSLGLEPQGALVPSKLSRADVIGRVNGKNDGSYCFFLGHDHAWGWAQNHQNGSGVVKWHSKTSAMIKRAIEDVEVSLICGDIALLREAQKYASARARALRIMREKTLPLDWTHPYFANKKFNFAIAPFLINLRLGPWTKNSKCKKNCILMPLHDYEMKLHSVQAIDENGVKDLLYGGKKAGHFFALSDINKAKEIILVEGLATGLSVQIEAFDAAVVVCVDAGNLVKVAVQLQPLNKPIIVAADNDAPGIAGARACRIAVNAKILMPKEPGFDWDDVRMARLNNIC